MSATTYCIIGAGAAGLTAAKNLKQWGIPFEVIEREDDVGGNWYFGKPNSSVYRSVHMISSKRFSEYADFPIQDDLPTYLSQAQAHDYLRAYARAFGLYDHIRFNRAVERVRPAEGGAGWDVTLDGGETRRYRGLLIANGHLWAPRFPEYPGRFDGLVLHSSQYKTPDVLRDRRVLVVGAGNSGCDIAVESCLHAARTFHSLRRGYYFWPKFMFGLPADLVYEWSLRTRAPLPLRRLFGHLFLRLCGGGDLRQYGLPRPDHKLFESHFIINSTLAYHLGHGDLTTKPDVMELRGNRVRFRDGTEETIDVIVYATGFHLLRFPFVDPRHLNWGAGGPRLYLNVFHPQDDSLFLIGLFQTSTGNWPLMDLQSQAVARFLYSLRHAPARAASLRARRARADRDLSGGIRYQASPRHGVEVEHFTYRAALQRLIRDFRLTAPPPPFAAPGAVTLPAPFVKEDTLEQVKVPG
jgi:cation diffusion facilitator CzcD-associated flavoprotein CzcO